MTGNQGAAGFGCWIALVPVFIVSYGRANWPDNFRPEEVPWGENYEVVLIAWLAAHIFIALFALATYMVFFSKAEEAPYVSPMPRDPGPPASREWIDEWAKETKETKEKDQ